MKPLTLRSRTGNDGCLHLHIPTEIVHQDVEVQIIVQAVSEGEALHRSDGRKWPADYFATTSGALALDPVVRAPEGEYDSREHLG